MNELEQKLWLKRQELKNRDQDWVNAQKMRKPRNITIQEWHAKGSPRKWVRHPENDVDSLFGDETK